MSTGVVLEKLTAEVRSMLGENLWHNSDLEARDAVTRALELKAAADALYLALLRDLDTRPEAVEGAKPGKVARTHLLRANLGPGQANRDLDAAHALEALPVLAAAFAAGEVTRTHVDIAVRTVERLPARLVEASPIVDELLTERSKLDAPREVGRLAKELLSALDPDGSSSFDPDAHTRRFLTMSMTEHGLSGTFLFLGAQAAAVHAALQHAVEPPAEDDDRSPRERAADGFAALVENGAAHTDRLQRMEPAHILVTATVDQVAGRPGAGLAHLPASGTAVDDGALRELMCEARFQTLVLGENGEILHLGRERRLASKQQRRALAGRDLGCVIPGCAAPPGWADAHHVHWWDRGGPTDIDNMALLCRRHHTAVHRGEWSITVIDGVPWAIPPAHLDPQRRPARNTVHENLATARRIGEQLRLELDR